MEPRLYDLLSIIIQALGFGGVIATLILTLQQFRLWQKSVALNTEALKKNTEAVELTAFYAAASNLMELGKLFVDKHRLRKYFYDGVSLSKTSPDYEEAKAVCFVVYDFMSDILVYVKKYPSLYPEGHWRQYIRDMFHSSPILCEVLQELRNKGKRWYSEEFYQLMLEGRSAPPPAAITEESASAPPPAKHKSPKVPVIPDPNP